MGARNCRVPQRDGDPKAVARHRRVYARPRLCLRPLEMERELLQENRLHEEIDRTIKRPAQVKGYKQLGLVARVDVNTSKLIEVSANKAIESARQHNNENSPELKLAKRKS